MRLIVDANIIFSAILRDSVTRRILLFPLFEFYAPVFAKLEIEEHMGEIIERTGLPEDKVETALKVIFSRIVFIEYVDT